MILPAKQAVKPGLGANGWRSEVKWQNDNSAVALQLIAIVKPQERHKSGQSTSQTSIAVAAAYAAITHGWLSQANGAYLSFSLFLIFSVGSVAAS